MIDAGHGAEYAASRGEYLAARMVATYFGWEFLDTDPLIVINHDGTVNPETWDNLKKALKPNVKYVVPGFYGCDPEGKVKTFSGEVPTFQGNSRQRTKAKPMRTGQTFPGYSQ